MKAVAVVFLLGCAAVLADRGGYDSYNKDGFRRVKNGVSAPYSNDDRQRAVNYRAEHVGASSGTAKYYDVPGTNRDFGYGYGRGGYGGYGNGYGSYGSNNGYGGYGSYGNGYGYGNNYGYNGGNSYGVY